MQSSTATSLLKNTSDQSRREAAEGEEKGGRL